jgi:predicted aspartyl protease
LPVELRSLASISFHANYYKHIMKKQIILIILVLLNFGCGSNKKLFSAGNAIATDGVEEIKINIINDLPLCNVQIDGREYLFLIDTGAPTIISDELFKNLNLKESHSSTVVDSGKEKRKEKFATLPEIRIGNLVFQNIGCAVIKIEGEIKCFNIDGIIGANLLAKLFFEFDYDNKRMKVSRNLASFEVEKSDFSFDFKPAVSKTPMVKGKVLGKDLSFTFDTGFSGNIKVANSYDYYKDKTSGKDFFTYSGVSSIGAYGLSKNATTFVMKNSVSIDNISFENEIVDSGNSTLIGNQFLKDYRFVIDWQKNKIYFKRNESRKEKNLRTFGFAYLFIDGKAIVTSKVEDGNIPLYLGDEVVAIDDFVFAGLSRSDNCKYFLDRVEKDKNEIEIKVKRDNETLSFHLEKQDFIK